MMLTITVLTKDGRNLSYNDKDYPDLGLSDKFDNCLFVYFVNNKINHKPLLVIPMAQVKYVKFKHSQ